MPFGQLVVGPPGSGKTTYCNGAAQYLRLAGRKVAIINLDPANDVLPYKADVDISDLVALEEVQRELGLGPNGGMVYCIDYLEKNLDWLDEKLAPLVKAGTYLLFDLPGQAEVFTTHPALKGVVAHLAAVPHHIRLAAVQCVDAHLCSDPGKYLSALLLALGGMLHLEMPLVNVLSKIDLVKSYGPLAFNLDYYCEVQDLDYLADTMAEDGSPFSRRFSRLTRGLCEVVQEFGLVSFVPLAVEDRSSLQRVLQMVDKANGYAFAAAGALDESATPAEFAYGSGLGPGGAEMWTSYQEQYVHSDDADDVGDASADGGGASGVQRGDDAQEDAPGSAGGRNRVRLGKVSERTPAGAAVGPPQPPLA